MGRIVEQWERQRPDLDASALLVLGRVERVQVRADAALRPLFAEAGLGSGDFTALAALRRAGRPFALSPGELAASMLVTGGAVTKRVDRLVAQGLVTRSRLGADGRGRVVALTAAGLELVDRLMAAHLRTQERLLSGLPMADRSRLASLLERLAASVEDHADDVTR